MACRSPIRMWKGKDGTFQAHTPNGKYYEVPCSWCIGCRLDHAQQFGIRGMFEAASHENSQFVTLTYDQENLPQDLSVDPMHLQLFMKRLRKKYPGKVRFMASGEYGETTSRPHYHAILFGLDLPDRKKYSVNKHGDPIYTSQWLDDIWQMGETKTADVTEKTCRYVAGYTLKDPKGNLDKKTPYTVTDLSTGEITERHRPFARFSNKPGIGRSHIEKYLYDFFPSDEAIIYENGKAVKRPVPKYALQILREKDPAMYRQVKEKREKDNDTDRAWNERRPHRRKAKFDVQDAKMNLKGRASQKHETPRNVFMRGDQS